jgi:hypothetical protein
VCDLLIFLDQKLVGLVACHIARLGRLRVFRLRSNLLRSAENEAKHRALVGLRFSPYTSSMLPDDALHSGKSYPGAFKFIGTMKALECSEEPCSQNSNSCVWLTAGSFQLAAYEY